MKTQLINNRMAIFVIITIIINLLHVSVEAGDQQAKRKRSGPIARFFTRTPTMGQEAQKVPAPTNCPPRTTCVHTRTQTVERVVYKEKVVEIEVPVYKTVPKTINVEVPVYVAVPKKFEILVPVYVPVSQPIAVPVPVYVPQPVQMPVQQQCPPPMQVVQQQQCPPGMYPVLTGYTHVRTYSNGRQETLGQVAQQNYQQSYAGNCNQQMNVQMPRQVYSDHGRTRHAPPVSNCGPGFGQHPHQGGRPQQGGGNYDRAMAWGHHVVNNAHAIGYGIATRAYDSGRSW